MQKSAIGYAIGKLLQVSGLLLIIPLAIALYDYRLLSIGESIRQPDSLGFIISILISVLIGSLMVVAFSEGRRLQGIKEGYAIVTLGWISLAFVSAIPMAMYFIATRTGADAGWFHSFTDAYFEIMSGYTTTGATILTDIEIVPRSILFLRALTHWLGGMGIITLAIAIFPAMGVSGYMMFRSEVPGPSTDKIQPRLAQTASILWGVYVLFSAVETVLLMAGGMSLFDAVCHTFATMATGGFSTQNASIAAYQSDFIEWVVIIFMYFAGINFLLHFKALRGDLRSMKNNKEFLFYNYVVIGAVILITLILYFTGPAPLDNAAEHYRSGNWTEAQFTEHYVQQAEELDSFYDCFRIGAFQALSIVTTTGFATADFDLWVDFLRYLLVFLMFFGGCAGSTGGGIKMIRVMVVSGVAFNQIRKLSQPRLVSPLKIGKQSLPDDMVANIVAFFVLYVGLFIVVAAAMTIFVPDLTTAVTCSVATLGNIGPGLCGIGAIENYAWIPLPGKWVLIFSMLLGRLEIFTVLIVLRPSVWRR